MNYFLSLLIPLLFLACSQTLRAQHYPVYNSFYINPYLYNPAEALTEQTQITALYRQQWLNVEGAPTLSAISFTTLLNETRTGIGGKFSSYERGILKTNDLLLTYAHATPISKKSWLFFGLSGGLISNTIDLAQITDPSDLNDPALAAYLENNLQPAANFGMLFRSATGLNLGFSLPQLFAPAFNSESSFSSTAVTPIDNVFVTFYYKRKMEGRMVTKRVGRVRKRVRLPERNAPLELYFNYKYSKLGNSQFEALGKLNLSDHFWLGASYRLPYGFTGNVGINTPKFMLSYAYEPGMQPENGFSQGSHEVLLSLRLGKPKQFKRSAPVLRSMVKTSSEKHIARFQEATDETEQLGGEQKTSKKKFYVVIKVFADFSQADAFRQKLIGDKYNAKILYNKPDKKYYVYVFESGKSSEAYEEARNLRNYTKLREARVVPLTSQD